jgi:DNA-binding GntR family transcriptional regulator
MTRLQDAPESLSEHAYRVIRTAVLRNILAPGYFASEREVAERFGLSRTPVREALLRLRDEGLVEVQPRRGVRVLPLSVDDVREIHQIARALELEAALTLAARPATAEDLAEVYADVAAMEAALAVEDRDAWVSADTRFHLGIVGRAENQRLVQSYNALRVLTDRARLFVLHVRPLPTRSTREHRAMLDAIVAGDLGLVAELYRSHWERTTNEMIEIIRNINRQRSGEMPASQIMVP